MPPEENQNTEEITTEENPVSDPPKQEVIENVPAVGKTQPIEQIAQKAQKGIRYLL
jgi:hypothetical protein